MRWLWPFNWYRRIRALERENAALRNEVRDLDARLRAAAITQCAMGAAYVSALNSITDLAKNL